MGLGVLGLVNEFAIWTAVLENQVSERLGKYNLFEPERSEGES